MRGDTSSDTSGGSTVINAVKGVYDSLNSPGTIGYGMFTWVTPDNHLWLFGGVSFFRVNYSFKINDDLWQYNPAINQWAWMGNFDSVPNYEIKGVGTTTTTPGGRYRRKLCLDR